MKKIPVAKPDSILLGALKTYVDHPIDYLERQINAHGDIFKFRLAHRYLVVTNNPDHIQHILQTNHRNYKKSLAYRKLKLLLGNGLFTNEGESWLVQRRIAQPAFHKERINNYLQTMQLYANEMIERWAKQKEVDILHESTHVTLQIISKTLLGLDLSTEGKVVEDNLPDALSYMMKRVTSSINKPMWWPSKDIRNFKSSVKEMNTLIEKLITEKRQSNEGDDLLSWLIRLEDEETGEKMDNKQLRDEVITFFLAGHETSAIALSWTIYFIETHPEVKEKLLKELDGKVLSLDTLKDLRYLTAIIQESLRMVSPIWILGREALADDNIDGYSIKKGDSIIFSPYLVHRNDKFWEQAKTFNPDRFITSNKRHTFCYFPFGGGPRLCVGNSFAMMELQVLLASIYLKNKIDLTTHDFPEFDFSLTLRPKNKIYARVIT